MPQSKTPAMVLQELSVKKQFGPPTYEVVDQSTGTHINRFDYRVTAGDIIGMGTGASKQISKHEAALDALQQLQEIGIYDPKELPVQEFKPVANQNNTQSTTVPSTSSPYKSSPNAIGPLKELCFDHKIPAPVFTLIYEGGPPHSKEFTFECCVASLKTVQTSSTKKLAKQYAAQEMLERVKTVLPEIAAACMEVPKVELIPICSEDDVALKRYNETYGSIIVNKTCKIEEYPYTIRKLMDEYGRTYEEFSEDISLRNADALKRILEKIEVGFEFLEMQNQDTPMVALILKIDTPFTTIGLGYDIQSAKNDAVDQAFEILKCFMTN